MSMNAKHCWAVITSDFKKADAVFDEVAKEHSGHLIRRVYSSHNSYMIFDDGVTLDWIHLSDNVRGYRFHRLWIDRDIDEESLHKVLVYSRCNNEDIIWI